MRLWATLISAQMWVAVASAETVPDKVLSILKDVCVVPTSSEEKMVAGEKTAAKENWKLFRSGPAPMLLQHNENGVKDSFESIWEVDLPEGQRAHFYIAALRPEPPDRKYTVCLIQPAVDMDADAIGRSIDRQLGPTVIKDTSGRFRDQRSWFFTEEKSKGNCGKQIYFSLNQFSNNGQPKTLVFTDFAYPNDKIWDAIASSTRCPNQ